MMRTAKCLGVLLAVLLAAEGVADVVMHMKLPRRTYMCYEPVVAEVSLRNTSGQVLIFGAEPEFRGYMEIELTDPAGRPMPGSGKRFELKSMMLRSGVDHRIRVGLSDKVNITKCGTYRVRLIIGHPMLRHEYAGNICQFEVSSGRTFWQRRFGVPKISGNDEIGAPPPLRDYTLKTLRDGAEVYYYLLVEDEENIYAMKRIGMAVGRRQLTCEIDMLNRLHVLLAVQPKLFQHQIFDWQGRRELNKLYKTTNSVPLLYRDGATGDVKVLGGEAATLGVDYTEDRLLPDEPSMGDSPDRPAAAAPAPGKSVAPGGAAKPEKPAAPDKPAAPGAAARPEKPVPPTAAPAAGAAREQTPRF